MKLVEKHKLCKTKVAGYALLRTGDQRAKARCPISIRLWLEKFFEKAESTLVPCMADPEAVGPSP